MSKVKLEYEILVSGIYPFEEKFKKIERNDEQELREYVRKVLLMYWNASIYKSTYNHKEIVAFFQSEEYKTDIMIRMFFSTMLSDLSFVDKRE